MHQRKKSFSLKEMDPTEPCSTCCLENKEENCQTSNNEVIRKPRQPAKHNQLLGWFCILLNSVCFTFIGVCVKKLSYINPGHLTVVRNAAVFSGCLPIAIYNVKEVLGPKKDRVLLIMRGFVGATTIYLTLVAFRYLPLAEAIIVMALIPAATTIAAKFYLKEPCGPLHIVSLVMSTGGMLLSVRLPELFSQTRDNSRFDSTYLAGLASAIAVVVLSSFIYVALRKLKDIHFSVPMLYVGFIGMVQNSVINFSTSDIVYPRCGWDTILAMSIGILGFFIQLTFTLALKTEAAGVVAVLNSSLDIVVAMIFQIIFIDDDIDVYNISGGCLVIVSVSMIGLDKWLHMLPEESKARSIFKYLM